MNNMVVRYPVVDQDEYNSTDEDAVDLEWLNSPIEFASPLLLARLGVTKPGRVLRHQVLNPLARRLRFNPDDLHATGMHVLNWMVIPLGDKLRAAGDNWVTFFDEGMHLEVAHAAIDPLDCHDLHKAIIQFRCGHKPVKCTADQVDEARRTILGESLAVRLAKVFNEDGRPLRADRPGRYRAVS